MLGYLTNPAHNYELDKTSPRADIALRIERNDNQGAWDKEGRIHFYGSEAQLQRIFPDLYDACSAGVGAVTKRIDSNGYILSLIEDYEFILHPRPGYSTADVFPPNKERVKRLLYGYLLELELPNNIITENIQCFDDGYFYKQEIKTKVGDHHD